MEWGWNIRDVQHPQEVSPPIHPLLRSLMENPELGGYVEHVNFWGSKNDWISKTTYNLWAPEESPKLADSELQEAMQWFQRFAQRCQTCGVKRWDVVTATPMSPLRWRSYQTSAR